MASRRPRDEASLTRSLPSHLKYPKLTADLTAEPKLAPSMLAAELKGMAKAAAIKRLPRVVALLNMSEFTHNTDSVVPLEEPKARFTLKPKMLKAFIVFLVLANAAALAVLFKPELEGAVAFVAQKVSDTAGQMKETTFNYYEYMSKDPDDFGEQLKHAQAEMNEERAKREKYEALRSQIEAELASDCAERQLRGANAAWELACRKSNHEIL